ncbi:transposase [Streptomyces sp. NPDC020755]|uniref:transposase n=1 Tax=Streptomyces sp. NPDC020755 TaxID=3154790 RepID=UPI0033E924B4
MLTDFRDRLCEDDRADQLLLLSLTRMREAGMVPGRGRQRTDSTRVPAAARDLTRLELVLEAVRAALEEAAQRAPDILDGLVDAEWATRHGRPVRLPSQPSHPVTRLKQAGADARRLLDRLPYHRRGPRAEALRQIVVQNFLLDARGGLRPRAEKDGQPKGAVQTGFTRDDFTIDFDQRQVICPNGETSHIWLEPPAMAPYSVGRFRPYQCNPCPDRPACARGTAARTVNFLPQHLHEFQAQNRANQQDSQGRRLYANRSGVEGTICEFINGYQARRSRYHGHRKTHVQHVLTGIAINIERLAARTTRRPRRPTTFQQYLDARGLTWECWWRQGK